MTEKAPNTSENNKDSNSKDFIRVFIAEDVAAGKNGARVHTRFPPEPNGFLHIGHAKAICISYVIAEEFGGKYNLRFDDTNPIKEESKYAEAIMRDIKWLGFDWEDRLFHASDYFQQLYDYAIKLIEDGKAYVDDLSADEIRKYRGTLTEPGRPSPCRTRSIKENLDLFERMKKGEFPDGTKTLRAKIDMKSGNINMRDPVLYRILHATHHRTGDEWCIYPMYDWAHGQSDSIEGITHSLCDLSFEDHRPLYDWFLEQLDIHRPRQIEFARLNLTYTVMSKRILKRLVDEKVVNGWDDPRMPTLSGMRRRGYLPESIRLFCDKIGVAKRESMVDLDLLEHCVREDLNEKCERKMGVLEPLKVVIDNYPDDLEEEMEVANHPKIAEMGTRKVPFTKEIYIERDDFMENPPNKFYRLTVGREVRLRSAYYITCTEIIKNKKGEVVELRCTYDPETKGGSSPDNRKVKSTIHWVSAKYALPAEIRLYDTLFTKEDPMKDDDLFDSINPDSLIVIKNAMVEPSLKNAVTGDKFQFERTGYFCIDEESSDNKLVFNRTVTLKDTWAKLANKN